MVPFSRDGIMRLGVCDVSKESIDYHLNEGRKQVILICSFCFSHSIGSPFMSHV
jgi:hypothetical protein